MMAITTNSSTKVNASRFFCILALVEDNFGKPSPLKPRELANENSEHIIAFTKFFQEKSSKIETG